MAVSVIKQRCPQNHPCPAVNVCPVGALVQNGFDALQLTSKNALTVAKAQNSVQ